MDYRGTLTRKSLPTGWFPSVRLMAPAMLRSVIGLEPSALPWTATGNLYGSTFQGGSDRCTDGPLNLIRCDIVFKLVPPTLGQNAWTECILHDFAGGVDGVFPEGGVIPDATSALVGDNLWRRPIQLRSGQLWVGLAARAEPDWLD
jgi:hypothetical protein